MNLKCCDMDYKEKVIALLNSKELSKEQKEKLEDIFPELKESEDERIMKWCISHFKECINVIKDNDEYKEYLNNKVIPWLEKQGEKKPVDSVEPKFKVGDWCIDNEDGTIFQIVKVLDNTYAYKTNEGKEYYCSHYSLENDARLWTIQDAKDGDVLVNQNGEMPFIFKECKNNHIYCYCGYTNHKDIFFDKFVDSEGEELHWLNLYHEQAYPATKEQRNLLFNKMKEAGYEWDAEKKELKKIEQKPAWSEEDEAIYYGVIETEQYILDVVDGIKKFDVGNISIKKECAEELNWLRTLKDRVQPQQEWSEEDEELFSLLNTCVCRCITDPYWDYEKRENVSKNAIPFINKLKSLRPQNTWKPSDEQMTTLRHVISGCSYDIGPLVELETKLKEL